MDFQNLGYSQMVNLIDNGKKTLIDLINYHRVSACNESEKALISIAQTTADIEYIECLFKYPTSNIRKAIALNSNTPRDIINSLEYDCVLNVSLPASKHRNASGRRKFEEFLPCCATCKVDLLKLTCPCPTHENQYKKMKGEETCEQDKKKSTGIFLFLKKKP